MNSSRARRPANSTPTPAGIDGPPSGTRNDGPAETTGFFRVRDGILRAAPAPGATGYFVSPEAGAVVSLEDGAVLSPETGAVFLRNAACFTAW